MRCDVFSKQEVSERRSGEPHRITPKQCPPIPFPQPPLLSFEGYPGSASELAKTLKNDFEKTAEFLACLRLLVQKLERGLLSNMRLKGPTRDAFSSKLSGAKQCAVSQVKENSMLVGDKYRAISVKKWRWQNCGNDPRACGMVVRVFNIQGRGLVDCVLHRHLDDDEWDINMQLPGFNACFEHLHSEDAGMPSSLSRLRAEWNMVRQIPKVSEPNPAGAPLVNWRGAVYVVGGRDELRDALQLLHGCVAFRARRPQAAVHGPRLARVSGARHLFWRGWRRRLPPVRRWRPRQRRRCGDRQPVSGQPVIRISPRFPMFCLSSSSSR